MRVQAWEQLNRRSLSSVERHPDRVELIYRIENAASQTHRDLEALVQKEQSCCGPAGVAFEFKGTQDGAQVTVSIVDDGLPAQTVVAAFAAMQPL